MKIEDYINSERVVLGPSFSPYYQKLYKNVCREKINYPKLYTCFTSQRDCEQLNLNGIDYIIYDQYLGQTLAMFNRIYYHSISTNDILVYGSKVLAEFFHVRDNKKMALLCYGFYNSHRSDLIIQDDLPASRYSRITATILQEQFVLLHEIGHWKFSLLSQNEKNDRLAKKYTDIENSKGSLSLFVRTFSDEIKNSILEELVCDEWAFEEIIEISKETYNMDMATILCDVLLLFESLQLLQCLYRIGFKIEQQSLNKYDELFLGIRKSHIRELIRRKTQAQNNSECSSKKSQALRIGKFHIRELIRRKTQAQNNNEFSSKISQAIIDTNIHYAEILSDPVMEIFEEIIDSFNAASVDDDLIIPIDEELKVNPDYSYLYEFIDSFT